MPLRKSKITHFLLILSLFGSKNFYSAQNVASKGIQHAHSLPYLNLCGPTLIAFITIFGQNEYIPVSFSILKFLKHSNRRVWSRSQNSFCYKWSWEPGFFLHWFKFVSFSESNVISYVIAFETISAKSPWCVVLTFMSFKTICKPKETKWNAKENNAEQKNVNKTHFKS